MLLRSTVKEFLENKELSRRVILLLGNFLAHLSEDDLRDGDITTMLLPFTLMSICKPMDQVVLEPIKGNHRKQLLSSLSHSIEQGEKIIEKLPKITLKDEAHFVT